MKMFVPDFDPDDYTLEQLIAGQAALREAIELRDVPGGCETPPIPNHHKQWFEQLKRAALNDDLALMSCRAVVDRKPRSVIAIFECARDGADGGTFIPLGHLAETDSPYDAYIPPA